jgi:hypothetical protein
MSEIEAAVWVVGIIVAGITATSIARSFSRAIQTVRISKMELSKENKNERQNDSEDR